MICVRVTGYLPTFRLFLDFPLSFCLKEGFWKTRLTRILRRGPSEMTFVLLFWWGGAADSPRWSTRAGESSRRGHGCHPPFRPPHRHALLLPPARVPAETPPYPPARLLWGAGGRGARALPSLSGFYPTTFSCWGFEADINILEWAPLESVLTSAVSDANMLPFRDVKY